MLRLTTRQIEMLASRPNAKRIAVENYLATMDLDLCVQDQIANVARDARLYGWNRATIESILLGIVKTYGLGAKR